MTGPVWFQNTRHLLFLPRQCRTGVYRNDGKTVYYMNRTEDVAIVAGLIAPAVNRWLDETNVIGDKTNMRICRWILHRMSRTVDWSQLQPPHGGLAEAVRAFKRLRGLVGQGVVK